MLSSWQTLYAATSRRVSSCSMSSVNAAVLITGASSGFGRLIAETLARKHYQVFATMRDIEGRNATVARELRALAARESLHLNVVELDVTNDGSVERGVAAAIGQAGRIDVLVNNAACGVLGLTESFTTEQAQRVFDTNFLGIVRMNRAVVPHMRRKGRGLLLYVSSGAGRVVLPCMGLYTASKFALEAFAETYRYELASQGLDSVIVQPGAYPTGILGRLEAGADGSRMATYGPVNEIPQTISALIGASKGNPQEIADAILQIIETPAGQRQFRYRIGSGAGGVQSINANCEEIQQQILEAIGLSEVTRFRVASDSH
jgi:NAD(P)-dependent dehydrogenase (short-subunit alcohol dehydrogenase family)